MPLSSLTSSQLEKLTLQTKATLQQGQQPDYIPLLQQVDPTILAIQVQETTRSLTAGETSLSFPLMSVVKPFLLLFLLETLGYDAVFTQVGITPSDQPFNSLEQLVADRGWPRNPMLNSGAIVLASLLPGTDGASCCDILSNWLNQTARSRLSLDRAMLASVQAAGGYRNREIANILTQSGYLEDPKRALDIYNHICCLSASLADLAQLGLLLALPPHLPFPSPHTDAIDRVFPDSNPPASPTDTIHPTHQRITNALMLTCGLYEASAEYALRIGLPSKSGVSGAVLSIIPGEGAIACYSPALDSNGNSIGSLILLEQLSASLNLSLFSTQTRSP